MPLCDACQNIDFSGLLKRNSEQVHKENLHALERSAKACDSCCMILQALFDDKNSWTRPYKESDLYPSHEFWSDEGKPITLGGTYKDWSSFNEIDPKKRGAHLLALQISFPGKPRLSELNETHTRRLRIYAEHGSAAASYGDILGRPVEPLQSVRQIQRWRELCRFSHSTCQSPKIRTGIGSERPLSLLPTRVVEVALADGSEILRLLESKGERGEYVALSYRWGAAKFIKTTMSNIGAFTNSISTSALCRTFKDAVHVTRKLGFRYIWIDALCIIQDSPEDWRQEAAQMADIYMQASLTLSASIAISADSGLFPDRPEYNEVHLPYRRRDGVYDGVFTLSNQKCSSFDNDVSDGNLSKRGWCLQERLLSSQIVHYGDTQLHWECVSAIWSEESIINQFSWQDQLNELRTNFLSSEVPDSNASKDLALTIYEKGSAGSWHSMLENYTHRSLTNKDDRLPAVVGLAKAFATRTNLTYLAGLWRGEIALGLLWNGYQYETLDGLPIKPHSPSWSWANFPGSIRYPLELIGKIVVEEVDASTESIGIDGYTNFSSGTVTLKGYLQSLERLERQDRKPGEWVEILPTMYEQEESYIMGRDFDIEQEYNVTDIFCLMMTHVGCGASIADCGHGLQCLDKLAMGLLVHVQDESRSIFRKIGVAKVYQSGFEDAELRTITIV